MPDSVKLHLTENRTNGQSDKRTDARNRILVNFILKMVE